MGEIDEKVLNLFALLPCPLKVPISEQFKKYLKQCKTESEFHYIIDSNANNQLSYYNKVEDFQCIEQIPDIIISSGINNFYDNKFRSKFVEKGLFIDTSNCLPNSNFIASKIKDPDRNYNIISMNILVIVVDLTLIGELTLPESFEDILKPEYKNKVAIRGNKDSFCETTLLTIYKEYGEDGIKKLGSSVMKGLHPSQMVRNIGMNKQNAPVISVMPYFYAKTIVNKDKVKIIWPREGAIISPVTMLVKKSKAKQLENIVDFFNGVEVGKICAGASFPSLNPEVDNKLPKEANFNWIGWDFIKENNIAILNKNLNNCFLKYFRGKIEIKKPTMH